MRLDGVPASYTLCTRGHPSLHDPPGCTLVRMTCGCALATATPQAMQDVIGEHLTPRQREQIIRDHTRHQEPHAAPRRRQPPAAI